MTFLGYYPGAPLRNIILLESVSDLNPAEVLPMTGIVTRMIPIRTIKHEIRRNLRRKVDLGRK